MAQRARIIAAGLRRRSGGGGVLLVHGTFGRRNGVLTVAGSRGVRMCGCGGRVHNVGRDTLGSGNGVAHGGI